MAGYHAAMLQQGLNASASGSVAAHTTPPPALRGTARLPVTTTSMPPDDTESDRPDDGQIDSDPPTDLEMAELTANARDQALSQGLSDAAVLEAMQRARDGLRVERAAVAQINSSTESSGPSINIDFSDTESSSSDQSVGSQPCSTSTSVG